MTKPTINGQWAACHSACSKSAVEQWALFFLSQNSITSLSSFTWSWVGGHLCFGLLICDAAAHCEMVHISSSSRDKGRAPEEGPSWVG